jgi:hypothetical protein
MSGVDVRRVESDMPFRQPYIGTRRRARALVVALVVGVAWSFLLWSVFTDAGDDRAIGGDVQPWTGRVYVIDTSPRNEAVLVVEASPRRAHIVQSIASGRHPAIAVAADGATLVQASLACAVCEAVLSVVDTRWGHVERRVVLSWPGGRRYAASTAQTLVPTVALSPDGRVAFVWLRGPGVDVSIGTIDVERGMASETSTDVDPGCAPGDMMVPLAEPRTIAIVCERSAEILFLSIAEDGSLIDTEIVQLSGAEVSIGMATASDWQPVAATPSRDLGRLFVSGADGIVVTLDLHARTITETTSLPLPPGHIVSSGASLAFHADSNELAVAVRPRGPGAHPADAVLIFDVEGWQMRTEVTVHDSFHAMTAGPDGSLLVFGGGQRGLRAIAPQTGRVTELAPGIRQPGYVVVPLLAE